MTTYNQDAETQQALLREVPRILLLRSGAVSLLVITGIAIWLYRPSSVSIFPIIVIWAADLLINVPYYLLFKKLGPHPAWQYRLRLVASSLEILMFTVAMHYVGGVDASILTFGYALFVMFAATAYTRWGTFWLAVVSAVSYTSLVVLEYRGIIPHVGLRNVHLTGSQQTITVIVNLILIAIVGFVATAFTERLTQRSRSLEKALRELRSTQDQLLEASRLASIGELAAGVAHEINNPVGIILGFAQMVSRELTEEDSLCLPLKSIEREAQRIRGIVQNLLDFARRSEWTPQQVDVNQVLASTMTLASHQVSLREIKVVENLDSNLPRIMADEHQLHQVFLNLILNAAQAMPEGGELTLENTLEGNMVKITIGDTGFGIPPEHMGRIFDPFFTTKDIGQGTGLGLAVSHGIIQRHQGRIEVESEPNRGTSFYVYLPVEANL